MKKIFVALLALTVLFSAVSLAEDSPSLSGNESTKSPVILWSQFAPVDFRTAVDSSERPASVGSDIDYLCIVAFKAGKHVRMVTLLDDRARELYMATMSENMTEADIEAFENYAWSLPVTYSEEITAKPRPQADLDALTGKTAGEAAKDGFFISGSGGGVSEPTTIDLSCGFFDYTFEAEATYEEYLELSEKDELESLKLKSGRLSGYSSISSVLDYLADGTYAPQVVPNITAEEAAAAAVAPPAEEYTKKAWPLDAESYTDLLNNIDARFGQVYLVKGTVHEVLSGDPLTLVVNTGEDGKSQPVVVKCPNMSGYSPKAGDSCRIYADVSSACFVLPELTGRYSYTE